MTTTSTTTPTSSLSSSTEPRTTTETKHYSRRRNENRERDPRTTRSKPSHLCIVIIWVGPASGRPQPTLRAVDLDEWHAKIISGAAIVSGRRGWASWC